MRDYEEKSYYEIQLDNKQLILVFLAGVTVCVLIFILGVMVGKGRKETEMALAGRNETATPASKFPEIDDKSPKEAVSTSTEPEEKPSKKEKKEKGDKQPADATDKKKGGDAYSFYDLDKPDSSKTDLEKNDSSKTDVTKKETTEPAKKDSGEQPAVVPPAEPAKSKPADAPALPAETSTDAHLFTVQVMATASKPKADQQLSALKTKGYTAFLTEEKAGSGSVYKVRVGKFKDSEAAKKMATRLKDELKLETWVAVLD